MAYKHVHWADIISLKRDDYSVAGFARAHTWRYTQTKRRTQTDPENDVFDLKTSYYINDTAWWLFSWWLRLWNIICTAINLFCHLEVLIRTLNNSAYLATTPVY